MAYRFEIFRGENDRFFWRFRASNGEVMCSSESYTAKASAKHAIESIQANAGAAIIEDKI